MINIIIIIDDFYRITKTHLMFNHDTYISNGCGELVSTQKAGDAENVSVWWRHHV